MTYINRRPIFQVGVEELKSGFRMYPFAPKDFLSPFFKWGILWDYGFGVDLETIFELPVP